MRVGGITVDGEQLVCSWRTLDDNDAKAVLDSHARLAGIIEPRDLYEFKGVINDSIILFYEGRPFSQIRRARNAPHVRLKKLRRFRGELFVLLKCLISDTDLHAALGVSKEYLAAHQVIDALKSLRLTAAAREAEEEQRQKILRTKKAPKYFDSARYLLIEDLACTFEAIFKMRASQRADGPWCSFLAAVLSRCEGRNISNDGALYLWKQARHYRRLRDQGVPLLAEQIYQHAVGTELPLEWSERLAKEDAELDALISPPPVFFCEKLPIPEDAKPRRRGPRKKAARL